MENFEIIQKFFENLKCSQCDNFFTKDAIEPVRREENNVVVRIKCSFCGKNLGLAILGLDRDEYKNSLKFENEEGEEFSLDTDAPITYEEVIEAHKFFSGLGPDWTKHLPEQD